MVLTIESEPVHAMPQQANEFVNAFSENALTNRERETVNPPIVNAAAGPLCAFPVKKNQLNAE